MVQGIRGAIHELPLLSLIYSSSRHLITEFRTAPLCIRCQWRSANNGPWSLMRKTGVNTILCCAQNSHALPASR